MRSDAIDPEPVLGWFRKRDPGLAALRRGIRAAVIMPIVFAVSDRLTGDTTFALFAAFGSLATLLLVSFSGSKRDHLVEAGAMIAAELVLICLGTAVSRIVWLAMTVTAVVAFLILFLSILKPSLGKTTTSLLVSFLLPVTLPASLHAIPSRSLAWLTAGVISLFAIVFLWPITKRDPVNEITIREIGTGIRNVRQEIKSRPESYLPRLQHAVRTAVALSLAVLASHLLSAQHALWVALGALTVLCSSAVGTSLNVVHALVGTVIGIVFAGGLIAIVGPNVAVCWVLLPFVVLYTGFAPVGFSFLAGQVGFTTLLLLVSNITTPIGWRVGIIRLEDILIGCVVSLFVGAVFWPRAAGQVKQIAQ